MKNFSVGKKHENIFRLCEKESVRGRDLKCSKDKKAEDVL